MRSCKIGIGVVVLALLVSCNGGDIKISDDGTARAIAYASGAGMGTAVNADVPELDKPLTVAWETFMDSQSGKTEVSPADMMMFYHEIISIVAVFHGDPYNLAGHLSAMLMIFGAEFDQKGEQLVAIDPVPVTVLNVFALGYRNGRITGKQIAEGK